MLYNRFHLPFTSLSLQMSWKLPTCLLLQNKNKYNLYLYMVCVKTIGRPCEKYWEIKRNFQEVTLCGRKGQGSKCTATNVQFETGLRTFAPKK